MSRIMVLKAGRPAIHQLGNLGRNRDDFIRVGTDDGEYYIGNFEEGFGFINVKFKKEDCRPLTESEVEKINKSYFSINGRPFYKMYVDKDGNFSAKGVKG